MIKPLSKTFWTTIEETSNSIGLFNFSPRTPDHPGILPPKVLPDKFSSGIVTIFSALILGLPPPSEEDYALRTFSESERYLPQLPTPTGFLGRNDGRDCNWLSQRCVAAGSYHTCAIKADDTVAWGYDGYGQSTVPVGLGSVKSVSAGGGYHTCAIKADNTVALGV